MPILGAGLLAGPFLRVDIKVNMEAIALTLVDRFKRDIRHIDRCARSSTNAYRHQGPLERRLGLGVFALCLVR